MNKKTILAVVAGVLIVGTLAGKNFGFALQTGTGALDPSNIAQIIGYNAWALLVYIGGGWLIYRAFKKDKPKDNNQK